MNFPMRGLLQYEPVIDNLTLLKARKTVAVRAHKVIASQAILVVDSKLYLCAVWVGNSEFEYITPLRVQRILCRVGAKVLILTENTAVWVGLADHVGISKVPRSYNTNVKTSHRCRVELGRTTILPRGKDKNATGHDHKVLRYAVKRRWTEISM